MTNRIAFFLAGLILAAIAADLYFETGGTIFMLKKLFALLNVLIFWR